jgi:prolyl-tRNA synthetase
MSTKLSCITTDFSAWYNDVVYASELADQSPVKGCIVIRPYGWRLWENIKSVLDNRIKETGHENASFPLLIPESFIAQEADHVEGFAPELAIVTHAGGKKLQEPYVIRPTSETMVHHMFARWIKSWRDLPLKINQWANVVRWEMRTRPFLRTTEFHWQEGHTAHATEEEASSHAYMMLNEYKNLIQNYLAIPVIAAEKPESERFAGADITLTVESLMQDGKALQMGTSHMLSQNFARSFNIQFQSKEGGLTHPYLTSWGVTTRLLGAIIMVHGDQKGLIMPPKIAPYQVAIIPIARGSRKEEVLNACSKIAQKLSDKGIRCITDDDAKESPGSKFFKWDLKGVPLKIEIGPRDLDQNSALIAHRIHGTKESYSLDTIEADIETLLKSFHDELFDRAYKRQQDMWHTYARFEYFKDKLDSQGGFYQTGWCRKESCENILKQEKATIRCVIKEQLYTTCFNCDDQSPSDILVAKAY